MAATTVPIGGVDPAVVSAGGCAAWPLPPDERGAGFARAAARAVLAELRMPEAAVYDATVALSELATNVYLHAYGGRDGRRTPPPASTAASPFATPGGLGGLPELWAYVRWRTRGARPAPWEPEIVFKVYDAAPWRRPVPSRPSPGGPVPSPSGPGTRCALSEGAPGPTPAVGGWVTAAGTPPGASGAPGPVPAPAPAVDGWATGAGTPPGASGTPGHPPPNHPLNHPPGYSPPSHRGYRSPSNPSAEPRIGPHAPVPPCPQAYAEAGRGLELVNAFAVEYGGEWGVHRTRSRLGAGAVPGKAVYFTMPIRAGAVETRRAAASSVAAEIRDMLAARGIGPLQMSADRDIAVICVRAGTHVWVREAFVSCRVPGAGTTRHAPYDRVEVVEQIVRHCAEQDGAC